MKGVILSVCASCCFGSLFYLVTLIKGMSGLEILGWRVLFMAVFLSAFMFLHRGDWALARGIWRNVARKPWLFPALALSSALIGLQFWLFVWAPANDKALDVSLGYFLLPLSMVVCGRLFYKDRLTRFQKAAVFCAAIGVANQLLVNGSFSWATLLVAAGFPPYFMLRKRIGADHLGGLWSDIIIMCPAAVCFIYSGKAGIGLLLSAPETLALLVLYGAISAASMILLILASRLLSLSLLGLLGYVEPVLLVLVSFILGSSIRGAEWVTYIGVWLAVLLLVCDGARSVLEQRRLGKFRN